MESIAETLARVGAPSPEFWENDLEMGLRLLIPELERDEIRNEWIGRLSGRQMEMVCTGLDLPVEERVRDRREVLRNLNGQLLPFLLVDRFSYMKSRVAVVDYARKRLPESVMETCRINEAEYDAKALLFALYGKNPTDLQHIFHLEKIQKTGFARMSLATSVTQPERTFMDFLTPDSIQAVLLAFDREQNDFRISEFREVLVEDGRPLLFIRRAERPSIMVKTVGVEHGFHPELIILDFSADAHRVQISSTSPVVPLEIANRLAGLFFGEECEYVNESEETYGEQLRRFLRRIADGQADQLEFVEIVLERSPLDGSCKLMLTDPFSICKSVDHFTLAVSDILSDVSNIKGIKVLYRDSRVGLFFEPAVGDRFVVRYTDKRLNTMERVAFEELMRNDHGIPVLSTEKRVRRRHGNH